MRRPLHHDTRVLLLALASGAPALLVAFWLIWWPAPVTPASPANPSLEPAATYVPSGALQAPEDHTLRWIGSATLVALWLGFAFAARERVIRPLQTIANLLSALGEGDFSIRARGARRGDALGEALLEVNALSRTLRDQRLGAVEATALLRTVMEEISLAVFAFDDHQRLRLVNRAGERLLAQPGERLVGRTADELGLARTLTGDPVVTFDASFPGGMGRWAMRRGGFRQDGRPHQLIVLADLSKALRDEERQAWQRLLRVLGHEINNSLAPIKSIAGSLEHLLAKDQLPGDWKDDVQSGLSVVSTRAEALSRFMASYSRLARLPPPKLAPVDIGPLIQRTASLETRLAVQLQPGPDLTLPADSDQLEQLLINLIRNAADAALETQGHVEVTWTRRGADLEIRVLDNGPGLGNTANLFVPFFTTKPGGSGIGLALSRQIAEAHHGTLTLANRTDTHGCLACLRLPLHPTRDPSP